MEAILAILSTVFAGTSVVSIFTIRSQKEKIKALASQEGAKADGLNLDNIRNLIELQGQQLLALEKRNGALLQDNGAMQQKQRENEYKIAELERKIAGMEKYIKEETARRSFAETHICLNQECGDRIPRIGTYQQQNNKKHKS